MPSFMNHLFSRTIIRYSFNGENRRGLLVNSAGSSRAIFGAGY